MNTPPWPKSSPEHVLRLMNGNQDAANFVMEVCFASHVYDDLIDGDKPVPKENIHRLVSSLLFQIPLNPFFKANEDLLRPLLITGVLNWFAANQIEERGQKEELRISHVLRYAVADVAMLSMSLTGGWDHAVKHARECRLLGQYDTWENYCKEHLNA